MAAVECVWRDYCTGERLEKYTKPWWYVSTDNDGNGTTSNCIGYNPGVSGVRSWQEEPWATST